MERKIYKQVLILISVREDFVGRGTKRNRQLVLYIFISSYSQFMNFFNLLLAQDRWWDCTDNL